MKKKIQNFYTSESKRVKEYFLNNVMLNFIRRAFITNFLLKYMQYSITGPEGKIFRRGQAVFGEVNRFTIEHFNFNVHKFFTCLLVRDQSHTGGHGFLYTQ